jgi:hypothetical protein
MIKSRRMRRAGHEARMGSGGEEKNVDRLLVGKLEGKRPPRRKRCRWVNNIKIDFAETGWGSTDWIDLAQNRDQRRALVKMLGSS